ncbi:MAG TPA: methyltransferase domain-containing protein [Candidatus Baltobacteraceae bacterium]|nr:methyltransferase domain-containing protein [Candidatus Baltobacteraceae bacterium]
MGIVPALVSGRSVIEFGPGSGHNAIYTSLLQPAHYVLVDGNPNGLAAASALLDRYAPGCARTLVESLIEDYATEELFDLVFCEGTIPGQLDTAAFCRKVGSFVAEGGIFIVTTQDAASCLGELLRRVVAAQLVSRSASVSVQLERLVPFFAPHTATIAGMSRPLEDWVLDNIIQPYVGNMFSVADAIESLGQDGFHFYSASPRFFTVWRWYKRLVGEDRNIGPAVRVQYFANLLNMIDYRLDGTATHTREWGEHVLKLSETFYATLKDVEASGASYKPVFDQLHELAEMIRPVSALTADSIDEALAVCDAARQGNALPSAPAFASFFGHGQQYLSFVRSRRAGTI